jgi:hypothetical protein
MGQKYKVNEGNKERYKENICRTVESMLGKQSNENREEDLDNKLYKRIIKDNYTEKRIEEFSEAIRITCEQSFKTKTAPGTSRKHKSVPWWTQELTEIRKTTNYLRRKYQKTRDNAEHRERNKVIYLNQNQNTRQQLKGKEPNRGKSTAT